MKHQVRLPEGSQTVSEASQHEGGDVTEVGVLMKLRRQADWGLEWMQRGCVRDRNTGSWIRVDLMRPKGCVKTTVLSLQLFGTLEPCPRAPHWGIRLDLPGTLRPTSGTIFRRFWEPLWVLDGASTVHPTGPSFWAFFLAP
jgi:hypothetical protein